MSERKPQLDITPDTKVSRLLEVYPELEETLIALAPAFAKLRNPVLRRTVARVTSLQQAARVGGVSLGTMINKLREAAGMEPMSVGSTAGVTGTREKPEWVKSYRVAATIDAREMLERGEHPVSEVMSALKKLDGNSMFKLISPFVPAPLIDLAQQQGYDAWTEQTGDEYFETYFRLK